MSGGGGGGTPANTTQTTNPWSGATPFMNGGSTYYNARTGLYGSAHDASGVETGAIGYMPAAANFYRQFNQLDPQKQKLNELYLDKLRSRYGTANDTYNTTASEFMGGVFDPQYGLTTGKTKMAALGDAFTGNASLGGAFTGNATTGSMGNGRAAQGVLDPTNAMQSLLSGSPDNPYLSAMNQANINQALRGYGDAVQNFTQQVIPSINNDAFAAGQYGSSRQGVAEGLAGQQMMRNARDLGIAAMDSGNQLFGGAYENAQGRKAEAANNLNNQAYGMEQFNANALNDMEKFNTGQLQNATQFNANVLNNMDQFNASQLQNDSQYDTAALNDMSKFNAQQLQNADQFNANLDMQQQAARAQNALQGLNTMQQGWSVQDNMFNQAQSILSAPEQQMRNALATYAGTITPGAGQGGTSITSIPTYSNGVGEMAGGAASIAGLLQSLKGMFS